MYVCNVAKRDRRMVLKKTENYFVAITAISFPSSDMFLGDPADLIRTDTDRKVSSLEHGLVERYGAHHAQSAAACYTSRHRYRRRWWWWWVQAREDLWVLRRYGVNGEGVSPNLKRVWHFVTFSWPFCAVVPTHIVYMCMYTVGRVDCCFTTLSPRRRLAPCWWNSWSFRPGSS